ncbi:hypothetical protein [uncultured Stenotrophomonas sp.]|uniref:hypothetical protein n=1 Tax=uncultured Stenotrophomonas sp. TaxID=165438 RepID=UPI0028E33481|nr:hypothetical protein [uncultured Stenotrophomonas sp.]
MTGIIGDVIEGIVDFVTDVWLLRRQRKVRGRKENAWKDDAADMVVWNAWALGMGIAAVAVAALMFFVLKLPLWLCLAPVIASIAYAVYRWYSLARA